MAKEGRDTFEYEGVDLEAMMVADNYYAWILNTIRPYLGKHIVEVGAGVGSFSKMILSTKPKSAILIEPSKSTHKLLKGNIKSNKQTRVTTYNNYMTGVRPALKKHKPDTFVYINVFEHIENDATELSQVAELLQPGGNAIIFVPALEGLYSNFDKSIDHFRRYTKKDLRALCENSGLEVVELRYMDMVGILPWWVSFVVMKRTTLVPALVKTYDKFCVPVIRAMESIVPAPVGKNVLLVARKPKK